MSQSDPQEKIQLDWRKLVNLGKSPSIRCSNGACVYNDLLWIIGGSGAGIGKTSDVWNYSLVENKWELAVCRGEIPDCRDGHSISYIGNGKFLLFGGQGFTKPNAKLSKGNAKCKTLLTREVYNDIYQLDCNINSWSKINVDGIVFPTGRRAHTAVYIGSISPPIPKSGTPYRYGGNNKPSASSTVLKHKPNRTAATGGTSDDDLNTTENNNESGGITDRSLLIFAGSGVEASKYTEILYNDLWQYSLTTNRWKRLFPRGISPRAMFDHRATLLDEYMVVVGGILGPAKATTAVLSNSFEDFNNNSSSSILLLNIKTLTWTNMNIIDNYGKPAKLNIHGHSLVNDSKGPPGTLIIFGGKETVDSKRAATESPSRSSLNKQGMSFRTPSSNCMYSLDVFNGVLTVLPTDSNTASNPENRYGHIGVSGVPVEDQLLQFEQQMQQRYSNTRAPAARPAKPMIHFESSVQEESVMFIFGGSNVDKGGFCDPTVLQLVRTRIINADLSTLNHDTTNSVDDSSMESLTRGGSVNSRSTMDLLDWEQEDEYARLDEGPSIWEKVQMKQSLQPRDPANWNELKLALTHSISQKCRTDSPTAGIILNRIALASAKPGTGGGQGQGAGMAMTSSSHLVSKSFSRSHLPAITSSTSNFNLSEMRKSASQPLVLNSTNPSKSFRPNTTGMMAMTRGSSQEFLGNTSTDNSRDNLGGDIDFSSLPVGMTAFTYAKLSEKEKAQIKIHGVSQRLKPIVKGMTFVEAKNEYMHIYPV